MKKLFIFAALLFGLTAQAQTNVVFKVGSAGYVTIDNQDYKRGYITYRWYLSGADTLVELAREYNTSQPFRAGRVISKYKDGDNASVAFASFAAWQTWWRANGAPKPDTVVSGGASSELPTITSVNSVATQGDFGVDPVVLKWDTTHFSPPSTDTVRTISVGASGGEYRIEGYIDASAGNSATVGRIIYTNSQSIAIGTGNLSYITADAGTAMSATVGAGKSATLRPTRIKAAPNSTIYIFYSANPFSDQNCGFTVYQAK